MAKILHLIPDEKVTDNVIENFERIFNDNIFYVIGDKNHRKYCKAISDNVIFGGEELFCTKNLDSDIEAIVIHGLNNYFARFILDVKNDIKIAWFVWGYDIYFLPKIVNQLYSPKTLKFLETSNKNFTLIKRIKNNSLLRYLYYRVVKRGVDYYSIQEKAHNRIDFFCTYIKEDYDLFISKYTTSTSFLDVGYFSIKQYLAGQEDLSVNVDAKNILIGNSNSPECNHLDVFDFLSVNNSLFDSKLIVPLNYGNNEAYRNKLLEEGENFFGDRFTPLLSFMDRGEYFNLLCECSVAIFYHNRQQAMGNIIAFLYMGGRVYLSIKNPVYSYLKRIGIHVFDLEKEFVIYGNSRLEEEFILNNRRILEIYFADQVVYEQNKNLVQKLVNVNR
ncbi:TDP-N-acetylfucosamine:lipid II N-acetylfucosaminyltransferase [Myroides odoratimimus]|uniref:4-alpha-L-fucosyltransferase glycosyl transferase group 56 n=1 Tax=Myroides odoratimimus CIP 101113 TaxID=883154 RepID=A0AAV3F2Y0_9FLAO|nr:TDP-N-acetylfucosamine:lipid II N-acetylfucosaminyltransferase [Myroides odoratimimus]EHO09924.1 hypothetical protein HMPREF9715_02225 [Myroides odoratimimus CIP 101113]